MAPWGHLHCSCRLSTTVFLTLSSSSWFWVAQKPTSISTSWELALNEDYVVQCAGVKAYLQAIFVCCLFFYTCEATTISVLFERDITRISMKRDKRFVSRNVRVSFPCMFETRDHDLITDITDSLHTWLEVEIKIL